MSATSDFYLARAAECEKEAQTSKLGNVRERNLRAAAAWHTMAEKIVFTEQARSDRDREKERDRQTMIDEAEAHLD